MLWNKEVEYLIIARVVLTRWKFVRYLMTCHPQGGHYSSEWFHKDAWLVKACKTGFARRTML